MPPCNLPLPFTHARSSSATADTAVPRLLHATACGTQDKGAVRIAEVHANLLQGDLAAFRKG
eukprot:1159126-Pelagomonas_calceolata.AAC.12